MNSLTVAGTKAEAEEMARMSTEVGCLAHLLKDGVRNPYPGIQPDYLDINHKADTQIVLRILLRIVSKSAVSWASRQSLLLCAYLRFIARCDATSSSGQPRAAAGT